MGSVPIAGVGGRLRDEEVEGAARDGCESGTG
jgi:hypothetical protein